MGTSSCSRYPALATVFFLLQLFTHIYPCSSTVATNVEYIRTSCSTTLYPRLCYNSLSIYASKIRTNPKTLAITALNLTLSATKTTAVALHRMSQSPGLRRREAAAMADCVEEAGDAVEELRDSMREMVHPPKDEDFKLQMSDIQTWVSAALTDEDTCMDGFAELRSDGALKDAVRKRIVKVAHLTSNALALVNNYASQKAGSPP